MSLTERIPLLTAALLVLGMWSAHAGPGDGTVVVIDHPTDPDVVIQDLRVENYDATHAPVTIRIALPKDTDPAKAMQRASITVFLTAKRGEGEPRLTEAKVKLGPEWANQSIVIEAPSPGPGEYFVNVDATIEFAGEDPLPLSISTTERVRFGTPRACDGIETVTIPNMESCPILFETKNSQVFSGRFDVDNTRIVDEHIARLDVLCKSNELQRVSVHGWASTKHSVDPTNEQLAQARAKAVVQVLQHRLPECADRIHNDSIRGTRSATMQFGKHDDDHQSNQCAQIEITKSRCDG